MAFELYNNLAASTTAGTINNSTDPVTFSVQAGDGALFPATASGNFRVTVSDADGTNAEVMLCTSRTVDALTCARAANATSETPVPTKLSHATSSVVSHNITSGGMNQIRQDLVQTGTDNSKTANSAGNLYLPNNGISIYRDTGAAFVPFGPMYPFADPTLQTFAWQSQGSAAIETTHGGIGLTNASEAVHSIHARVMNVPATPYHVIFGLSSACLATANLMAGVCFSDGTGYQLFSIFANSSRITKFHFTNNTTFSSTDLDTTLPNATPITWFRLGDDGTASGTARTYDIGASPYEFINLISESRTSSFTATKIGIYVNAGPSALRLHSLQITG